MRFKKIRRDSGGRGAITFKEDAKAEQMIRRCIFASSRQEGIECIITPSIWHSPAENHLYTSDSTIMNPKSISVALIFIAILLIVLVLFPNGVQGRLMPQTAASSTSQTLTNLQARANEPFKKLESSFRNIPPSRLNPIQNK
ncbi:hypothetical protein R6Q59_021133 [Mikania micrantha]